MLAWANIGGVQRQVLVAGGWMVRSQGRHRAELLRDGVLISTHDSVREAVNVAEVTEAPPAPSLGGAWLRANQNVPLHLFRRGQSQSICGAHLRRKVMRVDGARCPRCEEIAACPDR